MTDPNVPDTLAKERCGKAAYPVVPRLGLYMACGLDKGHAGECQPGGTCLAHGEYIGIQCPKWPACPKDIASASTPVARCKRCGAQEDEHYDLVWCPIGNGLFSTIQEFEPRPTPQPEQEES